MTKAKIVREKKYSEYWSVYVWRWWFPFWLNAFPCDTFKEQEALRIAKEFITPSEIKVEQ